MVRKVQPVQDKLDRFGVGYLADTNYLPFGQPPPSRSFVRTATNRLLQEALEAERSGFEGVFVPESHMRTETVFPDPLLLLAAFAATTDKIRLGTYALVPAYGWNPMHLAETTALIDLASHGRLTVVLGQGLVEESFRMFGVNGKLRPSILTEAAQIIKTAWTAEQPFTFHGRRFDYQDVFLTPKPWQRDPHPTLWGAALREAGIRRIAAFATGWCSSPFPLPLPVFKRQSGLFRQVAAENGVENPKVILMRDGFVAETRREAQQIATATLLQEWRYYFEAGVLSEHDPGIQSASDVNIEQLRAHMIVGTPDDCVSKLNEYRQEYGADYVVMRFRCAFGPDAETTIRCIRLFGEAVLKRMPDAKPTN